MAILRWTLRAAVIALLAMTGCDRPPTALELTGERLAVYGLLHAGADTAAVFVARYDAADVLEYEPRLVAVGDAVVRLIRGSDTLRLAEAPDSWDPCFHADGWHSIVPPRPEEGSGCYLAAVPGGIVAGEPYTLEVDAAGVAVTGEAVVPRKPSFLTPEPEARIPARPRDLADGDTIGAIVAEWTAGPGAARLELWAESATDGCELDYHDRDQVGVLTVDPGRDSAALSLTMASCRGLGMPLEWSEFDAVVGLTTYDTAYTRWMEEVVGRDAVRIDLAGAGLRGAAGVFAGIASTRRRIHIVSDWTVR